jgi:P2-related tail formation protein
MPARMRRAVAFRRGLTLTLSSGESLRVGVRALVKRRDVLAPAAKLRTPVTPLRSVAAHVLLPRWAKASLVHRKRAQVVIEIRVARDRGATQLLRRGVTLVP